MCRNNGLRTSWGWFHANTRCCRPLPTLPPQVPGPFDALHCGASYDSLAIHYQLNMAQAGAEDTVRRLPLLASRRLGCGHRAVCTGEGAPANLRTLAHDAPYNVQYHSPHNR